MKKIFALLFTAASMMAAVSCNTFEEQDIHGDETSYVTRKYSAGFDEATRTSLDDEGKVSWKQGDVIRYYSRKSGEVKSFTITEDSARAEMDLDVASTASFLIGVYGGTGLADNLGSSVTIQGAIPAEQSGVFGDHHVAITKTYDVMQERLTFHNLVSYLKFTLTRDDVAKVVFKANDGVQLHGSGIKVAFATDSETVDAVSFTGTAGSCITVNNGGAGTFYIATLPCTMANGFTADCYDINGTFIGTATTSKSVDVKPNKVLNLGAIDTRIEKKYTDLSEAGTANCYIVSEPGNYKFKADVKGNSSEALDGTPYRAEVLWESFGTDATPTVGDIVSDVSFKDGYIRFTSSRNGNAVIAVENRDEDILWSWHIWVCEGFDPNATAQEYYNNAGTVMDRNLGATSAAKGDVHALGLLYQWGRKDPFLGSSSISSSNPAKSTIAWPAAVSSNSSNGTIDYVVEHPTTFVKANSSNTDWYYTGSSSTDDTRWNSSKGMYDPCPAGWKVPEGGKNGLWSKALGSSSSISGGLWNSTCLGMDFTGKFSTASEVWYPATGCLVFDVGRLGSVGNLAYYWSCTPNGGTAYSLSLIKIGTAYPSNSANNYRSNGQPVRCVKESTVKPEPEPEIKDLSADGTANCYVVDEYTTCKFDATKKGHTNESVGTIASAEVLWESFGTDEQPSVGDIVKDVTVKDGIVTFTAAGKDGNAVIAVKNAAGDILWSWHIWVCEGFDPNATAQEYYNNAGTVMDRNLGATSATKGDVRALGLMYQWGRKDPFLSGQSTSWNPAKVESTITWPSAVPSNSINGTIDFVVMYPTTFVTDNSNNYDWYYTGSSSTDDTRWNSDKGMYDPCPKGWKVPDGGSNGLWAKAIGSSSSFGGPWDGINYGIDFAGIFSAASEVWYPASGYISYRDGTPYAVGLLAGYWSCTTNDNFAFTLGFSFDNSEIVYTSGKGGRANGSSVRCVKQ